MNNSPLWTNLSSMPDTFEEVLIVDLDPSRTTWSKIHEDLRVVYLKLNREPPDLLWTKFFHQERESRTMIRRRGLWIEDGYISFDCLPEEIEPFHLPDIQRSVDFANRKYREYFDMRRREMRASDPIAASRDSLEQMRSRLFQPLDQPTAPAPQPANATPAPRVDPLQPVAEEPMLPPEVLAAHEAAIASAHEVLRESQQSNAIVKRADQYRPDVLPPLPTLPAQAERALFEAMTAPVHSAPTSSSQPRDAWTSTDETSKVDAPSAQLPPPPPPAHPNLEAWKETAAKLGNPPPAALVKRQEITEQALEQTLAEYRAKVRAAFDAQKKKT